jgi:hypothetical protein
MNLFHFAIGTYFTSESVNFNIVKREIRMLPDDPETIAGLCIPAGVSILAGIKLHLHMKKIERVQKLR